MPSAPAIHYSINRFNNFCLKHKSARPNGMSVCLLALCQWQFIVAFCIAAAAAAAVAAVAVYADNWFFA